MNVYLRIFFSAFVVFLCGLSEGQSLFLEGQVISWENDTLKGYISDGGNIRNSRVCIFKKEENSEKIKYSASEIKSYTIGGQKYYVSKVITNGIIAQRCFLEVLLEGDLSLYYYYKGTYPHYYIEEKSGNLIELDDESSLSSRYTYDYPINWKSYMLGSIAYKDSLFYLFEDQIEVLNMLNLVEYDHKSLIDITKTYLDLTCTGNNCITYEKDLKKTHPGFGIYTGVSFSKIYFYNYDIQSVITPSVPVSVFYNIPMHLFNDRLSFQMEILLSRINYKRDFFNPTSGYDELKIKSTSLGVPLSINYQFTGRKIIPAVGVGKEIGFVIDSEVNYKTQRYNDKGILEYGDVEFLLHKIQKSGWFANAGIMYPLAPRLKFFSNLRIQQNTNLIIEDENYNNSTFKVAENTVYAARYNTYTASLHFGLRF